MMGSSVHSDARLQDALARIHAHAHAAPPFGVPPKKNQECMGLAGNYRWSGWTLTAQHQIADRQSIEGRVALVGRYQLFTFTRNCHPLPRVAVCVKLSHALGGHESVNLGRGDARMAEQLLNGAQVSAGIEQVCRKGVS